MEKSKTIEKLFLHIVIYSYLVLPLVFLLTYRHKTNRIAIYIAAYGVLFFIFLKASKLFPGENLALFQSLYTCLEFLGFAFLFWYSISGKTFKIILIICSLLFIALQVIYFLTAKHARLDSIPIGVETILNFIFIIYFFIHFYQKTDSGYIYNHYCFWTSMGILIYLGGSFFFYILINNLSKEQVDTYGNLTYIAELIKNLLFGVAIYVSSKSQTDNPPNKQSNIPFLDMI